MKKKYQYDEITYAQQIIESGFQTQYYRYELKLMAKYWKSIGIKPKKRKEMLYEFCYRHVFGFSREKHFKLINSTIAYSSKKTSIPIVVKDVPIYKHEFDYLINLPIEEHYKKVLFSLLVERKIKTAINILINSIQETTNELNPYLNMNSKMDKKIISVSKIPTKFKALNIYYELNQLGYIKPIKLELVKLNFIEELNKQQSEQLILINSFDSIGYYFDLLNGDKKISFCETCKGAIKKTSNRKVRCDECNKDYLKNYNAEKKREYRAKSGHLETDA